MKLVNRALGLSPDAAEEAAVGAVDTLKAQAAELPNLKNRITALENEKTALLEAQVDADLDKYKDRIAEGAAPKWRAQLIANRAATIELLESIPAGEKKAATAPTAPLHNRAKATVPVPVGTTDAEADAETIRAQRISNRANELLASNRGRGWKSCWDQATAENPPTK